MTETQQYEFKAEIKQLLDILVHSLYTNQEIFLRELISNASDALDKVRFEIARGAETADPDLPLEIRIDTNQDKKLLIVSDTGIGMTQDEIVENIGTIAHSGSAEFIKSLTEQKESLDNIIGKFGVGFYSVFMVADRVVITTKSARPDAPAVVWESDGQGSFSVKAAEGPVKRGTTVEIYLKDGAEEFADPERLKDVIKKHSNFISFPIFVGDERVNTIAALWREPKFSITDEQYNEFYRFLTFDTQDPLDHIHISVDAPVQFNALLFIPEQSWDWITPVWERPGLDLYVRRVLIQKGNKDLLPEYLGFLRGVIDSEDLPLNINRETIQENRLVQKVASTLVKQVLGHLVKMAADSPDKYDTFWRAHGKMFKMGYADFANHDKFGQLLRFNSSHFDDAQGLTSLDAYIERAKESQKEIYYVFGPSREAVRLNPHTEMFRTKGVEVLYLYEPVDEFAVDTLRTYKEWPLKSVEHVEPSVLEGFENVEDIEEAEPLPEEDAKEFDNFLDRFRDVLGEKVTAVRRSSRLKDSPVCLVNPDGGMSSSMQKIMKIVNKDESIPEKIIEVNQDHPTIRNLFRIYQNHPQDEYLTLAMRQLYESSLLLEGYLQDPHTLVGRIQKLLNRSSGWYLEVNDR